MNLRQQISDFYITHASELPISKQFHLASRLAAWEYNPKALSLLQSLRSNFVPEPYDEATMRHMLSDLIHNPPEERKNASALREKYFSKYPELDGIHLALFRVRHLLHVYGIDVRPIFFDLVPETKCLELARHLVTDTEAMRILSTFAINYIYLLERVLLERKQTPDIDIEYFYHLGDGYDLRNRSHIQLLIYLYTHCIIGETNFYIRPIPNESLPAYQKMLRRLERVIAEHFDLINLDNKLEFLVCCRICNYDTTLMGKIEDECSQSVSNNGTFLVDRHNKNHQKDRTSFDTSEHRNVLFIMSGSPYPHAASESRNRPTALAFSSTKAPVIS